MHHLSRRTVALLALLPLLSWGQDTEVRRAFGANGGVSSAATSGALDLFVATTGNDSSSCTTALAPCLTIQGAVDKIPRPRVRHPVVITVAAGSYSNGANVGGFVFEQGQTAATQGLITIQGELTTFVPATSGATGTATSVTNGTNATWSVLNDSGKAWTVNNLQGQLLEITAGTGAGQFAMIATNTATAITIAGQFTTSIDTTSQYAIRDWGTSLTGGSATTTFQGATTTSTNRNFTFLVQTPYTIQNTVPYSVLIRKFRFTSGVTGGVGIASGAIGVLYNRMDGTGLRLVEYYGTGSLYVQWNSGLLSGTSNFITAGIGSSITALSINNNVLSNATGAFGFIAVPIAILRSSNNYSLSTGTAHHYRLSSVLDGVFKFDRFTGGQTCLRGFGNAASGDMMNLNVEGIQCNDHTGYAFSFSGPSRVIFDQFLGVASTGTNASAAILVIANSGSHVTWGAITNLTVGGVGSNDFCINDSNTVNCITLTQLRSNATYKSFMSLSQGTTISEN